MIISNSSFIGIYHNWVHQKNKKPSKKIHIDLNEDPEDMNLANESNKKLTHKDYNISSNIDLGSIILEDNSRQNEISKHQK